MIDQVVGILRKYAAVILFAVGVSLTYVFSQMQFWSVVGPIFGVALGGFFGTIALLYHRTYGIERASGHSNPIDIRIGIALACLYATAIIVLFRFRTYNRPFLLYVLFGGFAAAIAYQIARGGTARSVTPQLLSLSFFTYWSSQFLFPAGMYGPDTYRGYLPAIGEILRTGRIPATHTTYAGHLGYAAEFTIVTGLSIQVGYFLLATLLLSGTVVIISVLDRAFPKISSKMALYAALIFATSSWMLGRGMHPNKLNFFYALILILGVISAKLYNPNRGRSYTHRHLLLVIPVVPAVVFGHRFSAGAAMVFLLVFGAFALVSYWTAQREEGTASSLKAVLLFVSVFDLSILGNPIHQGPLLRRVSGLLLSVVRATGSGSTAGGPGRYSELLLTTLIASTAAQTLLFAISILGAIWLFRKNEWEYDLVIWWMGGVSVLLLVSLLTNSVDTAPQRFYGLLVLFGFNVCAGALFYVIDSLGTLKAGSVEINPGRVAVVVLVGAFATASLVSPVADKVTSPVADDLPHHRQFETNQRLQGGQWTQQYTTTPPMSLAEGSTAVPIVRVDRNTGAINTTAIESGTMIVYSDLARKTGVILRSSQTLGGRTYVFIPPPDMRYENEVYTNGETHVFQYT